MISIGPSTRARRHKESKEQRESPINGFYRAIFEAKIKNNGNILNIFIKSTCKGLRIWYSKGMINKANKQNEGSKMAARKVFIVRGSEDGNIGVYGNKKAAYTKASEYVLGCQEGVKVLTYAQVCKEFQSTSEVDLTGYSGYGVTATIEEFQLNA